MPSKRTGPYNDDEAAAAKVVGISLLSAHGAGGFLAFALPFQIVRQMPPNHVGLPFLVGSVGLAIFAYGAFHATRAITAAHLKRRYHFRKRAYRAIFALYIAGAVAILLMTAIWVALTFSPSILDWKPTAS